MTTVYVCEAVRSPVLVDGALYCPGCKAALAEHDNFEITFAGPPRVVPREKDEPELTPAEKQRLVAEIVAKTG